MALNLPFKKSSARGLQSMKRTRRLDGTALIQNGVLLHDNCPKGTDTELFSQSVVQLYGGLEEKGEAANDIFLKFDGGNVLLMFRYPVILCLFTKRDSDLSSIEKSGKQFLTQFKLSLGIEKQRPKKRKSTKTSSNQSTALVLHQDSAGIREWENYRNQIENLLSKVLGSAQAKKIVTRELKAMGIRKNEFLRNPQFRPFGQKLLQRIKDKRIRRQIEAEMMALIE